MRPALLLCVLSLVLAACGAAAPKDSAKDFKGAERGVAAAVEDLESAARKDDSAKACTKLLAARLLTSLERQGKPCATAVKDAFKDASALDLTVDDVSISGTKATARVTSGTGSKKRTDTLGLERAGAAWQISSLTG